MVDWNGSGNDYSEVDFIPTTQSVYRRIGLLWTNNDVSVADWHKVDRRTTIYLPKLRTYIHREEDMSDVFSHECLHGVINAIAESDSIAINPFHEHLPFYCGLDIQFQKWCDSHEESAYKSIYPKALRW